MSRQSPNRNQRSKGIKIKHVLQICLLVAICFWLIYQVKHSHDRKIEFDKSDEKVSIRRESTDAMIKLGRKDTHSQVEEIVSKNAEHDDELEEEEGEEEEDKNEEDVQGEKKIRGNENEGLLGEEEIDEQERERLETEVDREEDFVDDQEEGQDGDDQENEEKYSEDMKKDVSHVEDADGDGDDRSSHEAREEHYKADDASSAVTHETQIDREKSSEHLDPVLVKDKKLNSEVTNTSENIKELGVENGQMAKGSNGSDGTSTETLLGYSQDGSFSNNTMTEGSHHRVKVTNSSTEVKLGNHSSSLGNITESMWGDGTSEVGKNEIFDSRMPETSEQVQNVFSDT